MVYINLKLHNSRLFKNNMKKGPSSPGRYQLCATVNKRYLDCLLPFSSVFQSYSGGFGF